MPLAGCRIFDGIDDYLATSGNLDLSPYPAVTLLARVWWDEWGSLRYLTEFTTNAGLVPGGFLIGNYYDAPTTLGVLMSSVEAVNPAIHQRNITMPFSLGAWHALGFVFDRSKAGANEIAVYVDGALVATTPILDFTSGAPNLETEDVTGPFANRPLFFMAAASGAYGKGRLSDVALYGSALSADAMYLYGLGRQADQFGSPIAYWPLEGLESPEPDLAGAHPLTVHGTTQGAPPPSPADTLEIAAGHVTIGGNGAIFVGEDKILALVAPSGSGGVPVNLAAASVQFEVRQTDSSATALLSKAATIAGTYSATRAANTQRALVTLTDTETATLTGGSVYRHSWKRQDAGAEKVLAYGFFYPERATQA